MEANVSCKEVVNMKDHYMLEINEIFIGVFERSELRYLIQQIDNSISVGLIGDKKTEMTKDEFAAMVAQAREAALSESDEDCLMCGS